MDPIRRQGIGMTSQRTRSRLVQQLRDSGISDERVLEAINQVPRHLFVDEALASRAYENTALPIGHGQTISQPLTVARMTEALLEPGNVQKVLEIGTGSGYQAAVLGHLVEQVFTVERILSLVRRAKTLIRDLRLGNVHVRHSDGGTGWRQYAPFDAILVAAAAVEIPPGLMDQVKVGGRIVAPVGQQADQELVIFQRTANGFEKRVLDSAYFVPMRGGIG